MNAPAVRAGTGRRDNPSEPGRDCARCERLRAFRAAQRDLEPEWHNAPVPSFGPSGARLLVVGLAPGLRGANRTGRPFTGDYAGDLLYETLRDFGFARGAYEARPDDGLQLRDCRITNAVRCVPPQNKPTPAEITACRDFLSATIANMPKLTIILALGRIAHDSVLRTLGQRAAAFPFAHGALHRLDIAGAGAKPQPSRRQVQLADSYHCSRYNTNTGRLTADMFRAVFTTVRQTLE